MILVRAGKIEAIGEHLAAPAGATQIDLSQMTVLPGLIDCHTHLADGARDSDPLSQLKKTAAQVALESVPNARVTLESGFTTVRDVGRLPRAWRRRAPRCHQSRATSSVRECSLPARTSLLPAAREP